MVGWPIIEPVDWNGVLIWYGTRMTDITDGTSQTFMVVEDAGRTELWRMGRHAQGFSYSGGWATPDYELALDGSDTLYYGSGQGMGPCVMNCTNDNEVYSFHQSGANILFADGSVHFIRNSIKNTVFAALSTKASGEIISFGDY